MAAIVAPNRGPSQAPQALGQRRDPFMAFNFVVEIDSLVVGGFSQVSGLESEVQVTPYREGGLNGYEHKLAGPVVYSNVVLSHGLTAADTVWRWYYDVTRGMIRRKNGTIMLLDRERNPVIWWNFYQAYPVKWVGPQLDAGVAASVAVEQIELVHAGLTQHV